MAKSSVKLTDEEKKLLGEDAGPSDAPTSPELTPEELELLGGAPQGVPSSGSGSSPEGLSEEELALLGEDPGQAESPREAELAEKGEISQEEIQSIAAQTGADPKELSSIAPLYGLFPEGEEKNYVRRAAGFIDRAIPQGLGTFTYKKLQDEKTRKAFDQLAEIAERRRSGAETVAEIGAGVATAVGGAKAAYSALKNTPKLAAAYDLASLFAGGAAGGVATSEEGEEVKGALIGAGAAGTLLGLGKVAVKLAGRGGTKGAERLAETLTDVTGEVEKKLAEKQPYLDYAEKELGNAIKSGLVPEVLEDVPTSKYASEVADIDPEVRDQMVKELKLKRHTRYLPPDRTDRLIRAKLAQADLHADIREFASYIGKKSTEEALEGSAKRTTSEALATIRDRIKQEGGEHILGEWRRFQAGKAAVEALDEKLAQSLPRAFTPGRRWLRLIQDGRSIAAQIDNRIGTRLEPWMDSVAKNQNALTIELTKAFQKGKPVLDATNKAGLRSLTPEGIAYLERTGDLSKLAPEQQQAMKGFSGLMETWRQRANELGLPIAKIDPEKAKLYIPRASVDAATTVERVRGAAERLGIPTGRRIKESEFLTLETKGGRRFQELRDALLWTTDRKSIESADELGQALQEALSPGTVSERLNSRASASLARAEDGVPNLLRETDLNKLAAKWLYNTFHHAHFREPLAELAKQENLAKAAKDQDAADFIHKLRLDMTGGRRNTVKRSYENSKVRMQIRAKELEEEARKNGNRALADAISVVGDSPEIVNLLMGQIYPNFLGASPKAMIQNGTQTYFMTLPEIGWGYGAPKILKAQIKAAAQLAENFGQWITGKEVKNFARERGHLPEQSYNRLMDTLAHNMKASASYRMTEGAINKFTNFVMKGFEISEQFNRNVALNMAEDVAQDLMQVGGSKGAMAFVNRMGRGYRDEIRKAISSGDTKKVHELVENYLIGKTILNYNRASMSEMGRELGPFFSVFSKWPTHMVGEVITQLTQQGALKGAQEVSRKYLAPLAVATMLTSYLSLGGDDNPRASALLGKEGLAQAAPIRSLTGILEGDIFQPPAVQIALKTMKGLLSMDPNEGWKVTNELVQAYMPGAVLLRLLGTDIPKYLGKDPEGSTLVGRAVEAVSPRTDLDEKIQATIGRDK